MPGAGRGDDRQPGDLRGAHDRADVVLAEHPLDGDHVGRGTARSPRRSRRPGRPAGRRCRRRRRCAPPRRARGQRTARARRRRRRCRTGSSPGRHRARARGRTFRRTAIERSFDDSLGAARVAAPADTPRPVPSSPCPVYDLGKRRRGGGAAEPAVPRLRRGARWSAACWPGPRPAAARGSATSACSCSSSAAGSSRCACTSSPTPTPPTGPATAASRPRGYLTLNPFKYAHPLLSIVLPLFFIVQGGIGLPGGAVYLHPHAFRSKRRAERRRRGRSGDQRWCSPSCCSLHRAQRRRSDCAASAVLVGAGLPRLPAGDRDRAEPAADPGPGRLRDHRALPRPEDPSARREGSSPGA